MQRGVHLHAWDRRISTGKSVSTIVRLCIVYSKHLSIATSSSRETQVTNRIRMFLFYFKLNENEASFYRCGVLWCIK